MPRTTLGAFAALLLLLAGTATAAHAQAPVTTDAGETEAATAWTPVAGMPLTEPLQVHARHHVLKVTLDASLETITVSGSKVRAQPFNGSLVGPTLHVHPGDTIEVTFKNTTPQDTNIHFHGMHVSPKGDGDNVFRTFRPGMTVHSKVTLPKDHPVGSYWYHAHFHGLTEPQLSGGMSGLIVVEGLKQLLPRDLRHITERQVIIRDLQTSPIDPGSVALSFDELNSQAPTTRLVNGLLKPRTALREGETQLWHMANISTDLFYDMQLQGHELTVIALDGAPVWKVQRNGHLVMPPGRRYDVLVTGGKPGSYQLRTLAYPQEGFENLPRTDMMRVDVLPASGARRQRIPRRLSTGSRPITGPIVKHRSFTFSFGSGASFTALINGRQFDPSRTNVRAVLGTVEEWKLVNVTTEDHPFHVHVNDFQVMSVNGTPYHAVGLQDVVTIPHKRNGKAGVVVIRMKFEDFTGHFVFHCHILAHEDAGMMMTVDVVKPGQPATPPPFAAEHAAHAQLASKSTASAVAPAWLCPLLRRRTGGDATATGTPLGIPVRTV
jgi:suppressor of ftsI